MKGNLPSLKQQALLAFFDEFIREHHYAPSYREVMRALEYKSVSTVARHVDNLIERGWLVKRDNSARSVEVVYRAEKGGQAVAPDRPSPTPSLPANHDAWLKGIIDARIAEGPMSSDENAALVTALAWLGFADLARDYTPDQTA